MTPDRYRAEFPVVERLVHLNHAGLSPMARRVAAAVKRFADEAVSPELAVEDAWGQRAESARGGFARLIGARADEIAFVRNTSEGLSLVAAGLAWRPGDNVIAVQDEYPSNVYPWFGLKRLGVETRMVGTRRGRLHADDVRAALDARTRLVAASAVDWRVGARTDLASIGSLCRERGALLCVDGIQAVGVLRVEVDAAGIDFLAAGGHKWLLGPEGCGGLFVSRRVVDQLEPVLLGWKSVGNAETYLPYHFDLRPDAAKLESGTPPQLGIQALGAAIELLHDAGIARVEARVLELTDRLAEGLRRRGAEILSPWEAGARSGIVTFGIGVDPAPLCEALRHEGFIVRPRAGGVRVAPHFYNDGGDIDRLLEALDRVARP